MLRPNIKIKLLLISIDPKELQRQNDINKFSVLRNLLIWRRRQITRRSNGESGIRKSSSQTVATSGRRIRKQS